MDWDIRHNISANFTFRIAPGEEYFIPFTDFILPVDDISFNVNWSYASGTPYTPQNPDSGHDLDTNSKRMDGTQQTNLKITKGFILSNKMNIKIFAEVENLFKNKNVIDVYQKTGSYWWNGDQIEETNLPGFVYPEVYYAHYLASDNPLYYNDFRGVTLGISFNF